MSDGMTEVYRRKNTIEKFESAFDDLYKEAPEDWLQIVVKTLSTKFAKDKKNKKSKKSNWFFKLFGYNFIKGE